MPEVHYAGAILSNVEYFLGRQDIHGRVHVSTMKVWRTSDSSVLCLQEQLISCVRI